MDIDKKIESRLAAKLGIQGKKLFSIEYTTWNGRRSSTFQVWAVTQKEAEERFYSKFTNDEQIVKVTVKSEP